MKGLDGQMQHNAGVFADRIKHHRLAKLCDHLPHDLDRLRLEPLEMFGEGLDRGGQALRRHH